MLNGNVGVMKSMIAGRWTIVSRFKFTQASAELTDSSNIARGLSMMPIAWSVGATIG